MGREISYETHPSDLMRSQAMPSYLRLGLESFESGPQTKFRRAGLFRQPGEGGIR